MIFIDLLGTFVHGNTRTELFLGAGAGQSALIIQLHLPVHLIDN